jgi:NTP pyrophosphatase (non-canonical NTP hydrolase)
MSWEHIWTTWEHNQKLGVSVEILHAASGLAREASEAYDVVHKAAYKPGRSLDASKLKDELGDVLYYLHILAGLLDIDLGEVERDNRDKLAEGKHGWPSGE